MNTQQNYDERLMKDLFKQEMIEKAPSGFTEKVMTRVSLEPRPVKSRESLIARTIVPAISIAVTLVLTGIALLLPAAGNEVTYSPLMKLIRNINFPDVNLHLDTLFSFSLPGYLPYLFLSILFLTIFDRGLSGLFHRGK